MKSRRSMLPVLLVLVTGCGLVVGVKDLEVDPQAIDEEKDSGRAPVDAGKTTIPDAGSPDTLAVVADADAGCLLKRVGPVFWSTSAVAEDGSDWADIENGRIANDDKGAFTLGQVTSRRLVLSGFPLAVPASATIKGVEVSTRVKSTVANIYSDLSVQLFLPRTGTSGKDYARSENYPTVWEGRAYGGPADLWGLELDAATVNSLDFGVGLRMKRPSLGDFPLGSTLGGYDVVQLSVYFCE